MGHSYIFYFNFCCTCEIVQTAARPNTKETNCTQSPFVVFIYSLIYLCNEHINYETYVYLPRPTCARWFVCTDVFILFWVSDFSLAWSLSHGAQQLAGDVQIQQKEKSAKRNTTPSRGKTKFTFVSFFSLRSGEFIFVLEVTTQISYIPYIFSLSATPQQSIFSSHVLSLAATFPPNVYFILRNCICPSPKLLRCVGTTKRMALGVLDWASRTIRDETSGLTSKDNNENLIQFNGNGF